MSNRRSYFLAKAVLVAAGTIVLAPLGALAQTTANSSQSTTSTTKDRWLHVRVISDDKGETVKVNVPLELAEKVLPAIHQDRLHDGKVTIDHAHMDDVDLRAILDAVRTSKDGEFVTVQKDDCDVRVAKKEGQLLIHVVDKGVHEHEKGEKGEAKKSTVEVKVPMKVVDALFSAGKDELDLVAALRALSSQGDVELVSVKDHENTVRVWLDSKNVSD